MKNFILKTTAAISMLFVLSSCEKEGLETISKNFTETGFTKLNLGSNFEITVTKGSPFNIKATGRERDVNDLRSKVENGEFNLSYQNYMERRQKVTVNITMPSLTKFQFNGNSRITVSGFTETSIVDGNVNGNSKANISMAAPEFKLDVSGNSELTLIGQSAKVEATVSGNSFLDTYNVPALLGKIVATGNSTIKVFASRDLFADASGGSHIYFKGNPGNRFFSETSDSKIIEE
jgi:hypothetical protein